MALKLILASQSEQRKALLKEAGFDVQVEVSEVDEVAIINPQPKRTALLRAEAKNKRLSQRFSDQWVISGDTVVESQSGDLIGSPETKESAQKMLRSLCGTCHSVHSAVVLSRFGQIYSHVDTATIVLRRASEVEIEQYVATGEPIGKAGGLCVQGNGRNFVDRIEGSLAVVRGIPIDWVKDFFKSHKSLQ